MHIQPDAIFLQRLSLPLKVIPQYSQVVPQSFFIRFKETYLFTVSLISFSLTLQLWRLPLEQISIYGLPLKLLVKTFIILGDWTILKFVFLFTDYILSL